MVDPQWIYGIEGPSEIYTQSAEVRLAVSGAQPLFTLGLLMFALSLVDFLSLLLSPSTYFKIFYFCQKYHLKDTYKIFKKFHVGWKFEWGLKDQNWLSCESLPFEVFFSCLCDGHLGIAYANMLATTQWPLERAAHLTSLVWVCVLWLPESLMDLSALCFVHHQYGTHIVILRNYTINTCIRILYHAIFRTSLV